MSFNANIDKVIVELDRVINDINNRASAEAGALSAKRARLQAAKSKINPAAEAALQDLVELGVVKVIKA